MEILIFRISNQFKIIFLFILFFSISCTSNKEKEISINKNLSVEINNYNDLKDIFKSKSKAVFVSYDTLSPDFGKIMLLDLITLKNVELIDNKYYNSNPVFFDKNDKILFASARIGNSYQLRITTYHAWRQLYLIDIYSPFVKPFFITDEAPVNYKIIKFTGLCRDFGRKQIYFLNDDDNKMYKIQDNESIPVLLTPFDKDLLIFNLQISPDEKYIAVWYTNMKNLITGIYIYNITSNSIINDIKNPKKSIRSIGWIFDNDLVYQTDSSFYTIDVNSNIKTVFDIGIDSKKFYIRSIYAEDEDSIILLIDKLIFNQEAEYGVAKSTEIARYNIKTRRIEWLTNDGYIKKDLCVFSTSE